MLIDPLPYARPSELVQLRSEFPAMQEQAHEDWVVWNDVRELPRRTRTLQSIGAYGNAIFDLAGDANATPEALYCARECRPVPDAGRVADVRTRFSRFLTMLLAATGVLALIMAVGGVYGVISYTTARRTREIGIRMVAGATPGDVFALIFQQGFVTVAAGLGVGLVLGLISLRWLASMIPGLAAGHLAYTWTAIALRMGIAGVACGFPRVEPRGRTWATALRYE